MRWQAILLAPLLLASCASLPPTKNADGDLVMVDVRAAEIVDAPEFDVSLYFANAGNAYNKGRFSDAMTLYQHVILRAPKDFEDKSAAHLGFADSALALSMAGGGNNDDVLLAAKAALAGIEDAGTAQISQRHAASQTLLAIALQEVEDIEVSLNAALEISMQDARLWNALGALHDERGEWMAALETYVKAAYIAKGNNRPVAPIINNMGMSLLRQGRTKEALEKFDQAVSLNPKTQIYDNNRRLSLMVLGQVDAASKGLEDLKLAKLYNDAAFISASKRDVQQAKMLYQSAINVSPVYFELAEKALQALEYMPKQSAVTPASPLP